MPTHQKELSDLARLTCDYFSAECWYRKCSTICYDPIVEIKRREKVIIDRKRQIRGYMPYWTGDPFRLKTAPLTKEEPMGERKLAPKDFEQAWDLLKFRIAEKTSWGKKEILNVMATIESLLFFDKAERYSHTVRIKEEKDYGEGKE